VHVFRERHGDFVNHASVQGTILSFVDVLKYKPDPFRVCMQLSILLITIALFLPRSMLSYHCTSAIDCVERLVSEMTCFVSSALLNSAHWLKLLSVRVTAFLSSCYYGYWRPRADVKRMMYLPWGVCWWLKKGWGPVDVFRKGIWFKISVPVTLSWHVLSLHFSSFTAVPFCVWEGHGGMVLKRMYGEAESRGN